MKKYIAYVLEETWPINESAKICTTPLSNPKKYTYHGIPVGWTFNFGEIPLKCPKPFDWLRRPRLDIAFKLNIIWYYNKTQHLNK